MEAIKWDEGAVDEIIKEFGVGQDKKISLERFLERGFGVCRHQALACGVILERFSKEGYIQGKASIDRNLTHLGGHVWCRYINSKGEIIILDVAQNFFGYLSASPPERRLFYERPE